MPARPFLAGTEVEPDVKIAADQALELAEKLAAQEIDKSRMSAR
jgi:hypothetical protein